jgi:hypothetical protein
MDRDDITREHPGGGWYRRKVGRRVELGMNRLIGGVLGAAGLLATYLTLGNGVALADDWFGLLAGALLLFLSRLCFKARRGIIEGFGEEPSGNEPLPRRRK